MAFTIEVWRGNNPVKRTRVGIIFSGIAGTNTHQYTDNVGRAFFPNDTAKGTVYMDKERIHTGYLSGTIKITL
jgi:nicotinamide mononucleotide (NMN) deamidase PncC